MLKRIISCLLLVLMLIPVISPVFATNANEELQVDRNKVSSVDSILNEYHEKVFAAKIAANANARSGAEVQTDEIKQDTLEQLWDAGYLAYDVNPDNFDSVAEELKTDLREMDLDPNGSYIIVISGEEEPQDNNSSRAVVTPDLGGDGFDYTYNGTVYKLKMVTITAAPDNGLVQSGSYDLFDVNNGNDDYEFLLSLLETAISMYLDSQFKFPIGTIGSLLNSVYLNQNYTNVETLVFQATATWTKTYTLVRGPYEDDFHFGSRVERVKVKYFCNGLVWDDAIGDTVSYQGELKAKEIYSEYYNDTEQQKIQAVLGCINGIPNNFTTGPVEFKYGGRTILRFNNVSY